MSRTRAELDDKLARLQARVSELTPQRLTERYVPDFFIDRVIGGVLTIVGLKMAWAQYRHRHHRRERMRAQLASTWVA
jgi:hypothetical protein